MQDIKILVVEDESIVAMELQHRLEILGFIVCEICSIGERAIELADKYRPDLVLMDIKLKGAMNGILAARIIKEKFKIPSVFITANSDQMTIKQIDETLNFEYLFKPFDQDDIIAAIEKTLKK